MKILHLSAVKSWGGGENHLENLIKELRQYPEVNSMLFCVENSLLHEHLKKEEIKIFSAPLYHKMDPRYFLKLGRICASEKIEIIHIHDSTALALAVLADHFYDLPPFIFSKKTSFPIKTRKQTIFKYNYPKIRKILCVSDETRKIAQLQVKDHAKLETIYHGTNVKNPVEKCPFSIRSRFNIPKDKKIIGNIANHIRAKNLETFLEVANHLINVENRKDFFFLQIGAFTKRSLKLKETVKKLKLENHVVFTDFIPNAAGIIPEFDITLITSQSEGLPQVIYESFYHNVPVISTNVGGIPEAIVHKRNGLLTEKHDPQKLASEILFLNDHPELRQEYVLNSHQKLENCFNTVTMAEKTLAEYKKVIDGKF